jgi:hypothetical protein
MPKLAFGSSSLMEVAAAAGLPIGTVKASRSRVPGLREAMDSVGNGPLDWGNLAEENVAGAAFWRARSPEKRAS